MVRKVAIALGMTAVVMMVTGILAGCSWLGAPSSTEELLVRYATNQDASNFTASAQADLSVSALGINARLPITANAKAADNVAHGTVTINLSSLKVPNYTVEFYTETQDSSIVCYLGAPAFDRNKITWKRWDIDTTSTIDISVITDLLRNAELTPIAKSSDDKVSYELAIPAQDALQTVFKLSAEPIELAGMSEQDLLDAVETDKVRFDFTKDCLLRSANTSVLLSLRSAATNDVAIRIGLDASVVLDDYGKTDPEELIVPNDIKQSAVLVDEPISILDIIGPDTPLARAVPQ